MVIFSDKELKIEIKDPVLYENQDYYFRFTAAEILQIKSDKFLSSIIEILPYSEVGKAKFTNQVGFVTILKNKFDIRSLKFRDVSGNEQAKTLIDDINSTFRQFTFHYSSITAASRQVNFSSINADILSRFDYLKQAILSDNLPTFENCLDVILKQPHHKLSSEKTISPIHKVKNISQVDIFGPHTKYVNYDNIRIERLSLSQKLIHKGKKLFPSVMLEYKHTETYDTPENRFIKFFLEEISSLSQYIVSTYEKTEKVHLDAIKIKTKIDSYLARNFFRSIGKMNFVPYSSTTLLNRNGYKELFQHFIKSRYSFNHLLERINKEFDATGLNKISYLYEVWCFLKICSSIFNKDIEVLADTPVFKNDVLTRKFVWANDKVLIGFNLTYSFNQKNSYSLSLRPDISLTVDYGKDTERLVFFDAKYKVAANYVDLLDENSTVDSKYKAEDIHKMHSYLDAIPHATSSFVLYPGSKFIYYRKDFTRFTESTCEITKGVGAVPLMPGQEYTDLENLLKTILG